MLSFIYLATGCMLVVIDHHYYHKATIALLEKQISTEQEKEARILYENALRRFYKSKSTR